MKKNKPDVILPSSSFDAAYDSKADNPNISNLDDKSSIGNSPLESINNTEPKKVEDMSKKEKKKKDQTKGIFWLITKTKESPARNHLGVVVPKRWQNYQKIQ